MGAGFAPHMGTASTHMGTLWIEREDGNTRRPADRAILSGGHAAGDEHTVVGAA
jgi:hypothetical protein